MGYKLEVDPELVLANKDLSLREGGVLPWSRAGSSSPWYGSMLESIARSYGFSTREPIRKLSEHAVNLILYGNEGESVTIKHTTQRGRVYSWKTNFEGVIPNLERRFRDTDSDYIRREIERYMAARPCQACRGLRLRPEALSVKVDGRGIMDVCGLPVTQALQWANGLATESSTNGTILPLSAREKAIAQPILKEIFTRLQFLENIGLGYLTVDRSARTLSGGEAQRIRLATQIGSGLTGVLYVCDEPTIGLHPFDDNRLIGTLNHLRDLGNTVIVVEHDEAIMRAANFIVDLGPGAGEHGGNVVVTGTIEDVMSSDKSLTGLYLSGRKTIPMPEARRDGNGAALKVKGARENNLKNVSVKFPLGRLVCVTGVSGSGKSTLVYEILYKRLAQTISRAKDRPGKHDAIEGMDYLDKVINIDQSPIGRTPRSNPATYTGAFTPIRDLFASLPESKARGYKPGRFSFNVKGGRCEACKGEGYTHVEMQFLPDVTVPCEVCKGRRYNREALEIHYKEKSIADVLGMTVYTALEFFQNIPKIRNKMETMRDVGLGYIRLGQPATTLSGGEAQTGKALHGAFQASYRQDPLSAGRADHWSLLLRLRRPTERAAPAGGRGQLDNPHRAPPGHDQERGLDNRHGPRPRRQGRAGGGRGNAGTHRIGGSFPHRPLPEEGVDRVAYTGGGGCGLGGWGHTVRKIERQASGFSGGMYRKVALDEGKVTFAQCQFGAYGRF